MQATSFKDKTSTCHIQPTMLQHYFAKIKLKKYLINISKLTLNQHHKLLQSNRKILDRSCKEEYTVLQKLDTWEIISEDKYKLLCKSVGPTISTIAIITTKRDKDGNPEGAKYRIYVLENLDLHNQEKSDCFAPALLAVELHFLINLAVKHKCIPKTGDVSQAFCQAYLP